MTETQRPTSYETLWDEYSRHWEKIDKPGSPTHLGDEWGSAKESQNLFDQYLKPWLGEDKVIAEIGPGGGKYTMMAAPHVKELRAIDVSTEMIERTRKRIEEAGLSHVQCLKGNGLDLAHLADESMDVIFSFDVFVHIAPIDTYAYLQEMRRALKPGGIGALTLANILSDGGFAKFVSEVDQHRAHTRGAEQFGYLTPTVAARFLFSLGYSIVGYSDEINNRDFVVVFRKDAPS